MILEKLKFPIGRFNTPKEYNSQLIENWIKDIQEFPSLLRGLVEELNSIQLEKTYRPEGWSIIQVVNHCADSHMNAFIRFKLSLTEELAAIRPYEEAKWAELADGILADLNPSLNLLEGLHFRWVVLLKSLTEEELKKRYFHPEHQKEFELREAIANYSWHCIHHLEHIKLAIRS